MNSVAMSGGSAHQPMNRSRLGCRNRHSVKTSSRSLSTTSGPRSSSCFTATVVPFQVPRNTSAKPPTATRSRKRSSAGAMVHSAAARTPAAASAAPSMSGEDAPTRPPASAT